MTALLGHLAIQRKARLLIERRRAFCLSEDTVAGQCVVAVAAANIAEAEGRRIVVLTSALSRSLWVDLFRAQGYRGDVTAVSIQQHSAAPDLLDPEAVLVLDGPAMTLNTKSVSWGHFAPVLRAARTVLLTVDMAAWPAYMRLSELVCHYDYAVPVFRREL